MDASEYQIRLSKGVIAKFVQRKRLAICHSAIEADAPVARAVLFAPLSLTPGSVGGLTPNIKSHRNGGFCVSCPLAGG
jgi:hypothetical protein